NREWRCRWRTHRRGSVYRLSIKRRAVGMVFPSFHKMSRVRGSASPVHISNSTNVMDGLPVVIKRNRGVRQPQIVAVVSLGEIREVTTLHGGSIIGVLKASRSQLAGGVGRTRINLDPLEAPIPAAGSQGGSFRHVVGIDGTAAEDGVLGAVRPRDLTGHGVVRAVERRRRGAGRIIEPLIIP